MNSFVRWAGGKTQLMWKIMGIIDYMRERYDSFIYCEPFVGSGAVLLEVILKCSNLKYAVINDANPNLMNCYRVIADSEKCGILKDRLSEMSDDYHSCSDKRGFFLEMKNIYNTGCVTGILDDVERASVFIFLNKTCYNGIYRENIKGEFNVSWCKRDKVTIFNPDDFDKMNEMFREKVVILEGDYLKTGMMMDIARADKCGLIYYLDPPYRPLEGVRGFVSYTKNGFNDKRQEELKSFCDKINNNGYDFILSNSKSGNYFESLYDGYKIETVTANRKGNGHGKVDELIIYNRGVDEGGLF